MTGAESRVAGVTGASSGLGRDIAVAARGRGPPVAVVARSGQGVATAVDEIVAAGGQAVAVPTDVSDAGAVERMRQRVLDTLGAPSIVVNAAGVFGPIQLIKD